MSVSERVWNERREWATREGKSPSKVFLSPLMTANALMEARPCDVPIDQTMLGRCWLFGPGVMRMDWYEDPELSGEEIRFE